MNSELAPSVNCPFQEMPLKDGATLDDIIECYKAQMPDRGPDVLFGPEHPGGIMVFGPGLYEEHELNHAFELVNSYGYEVADIRPEWRKFTSISNDVSAADTLRLAIDLAPFPLRVDGVTNSEFEFLRMRNLIRTLWRNMRFIWQREFGPPVPEMPVIASRDDNFEDKLDNAIGAARAWCWARLPKGGKDEPSTEETAAGFAILNRMVKDSPSRQAPPTRDAFKAQCKKDVFKISATKMSKIWNAWKQNRN